VLAKVPEALGIVLDESFRSLDPDLLNPGEIV